MEALSVQSFGVLLRERREALGLSRAALAQTAHVAETTIKAIELGRRKPSADLLRRLARCTAMEDSQSVPVTKESSVLNCWIAPGFNSLRLHLHKLDGLSARIWRLWL